MNISPVSLSQPVEYSPVAPVTLIAPVTPVEPVTPVSPATAVDTPDNDTGVILQFSPKSEGRSGHYAADGLPVEDSKRIKMEKSRMKQDSEPCQTCAERKYQDGSDDSGVSFQAPTNVAPEAAASLIRAHEQEHVSREGSKAREKGLNATSTVAIHTDICPECKKVYVSGGTTTTQFTADPSKVVDAYAKQTGKNLEMLMGA